MVDSSVYTEVEVANGETVAKPADPTKEGYTFTNWYENEPLTIVFDFSTEITSDWTLYAGWQVSSGSTSESESEGGTSEGGTSESESTSSSAYTYTCTGLPEWITNDGCVIFAWAWVAGSEGNWYDCSYASDATYVTFDVDAELQGFLLVRCVMGTTTPDWYATDNNTGRIYNQTEDISCTSGTYTYTCSEWKEYTPS